LINENARPIDPFFPVDLDSEDPDTSLPSVSSENQTATADVEIGK
jgi:hypothetical protein